MLYSDDEIVVLDDTFAALDGTTEGQVIENLFGENGWLRKANATVFWITNAGKQRCYRVFGFGTDLVAAQHFHHADTILLLEDNTISKRGTPEEMASYVSEVKKFDLEKPERTPATATTQSTAMARAKSQAKKDSENDLSRATGDFSLYG